MNAADYGLDPLAQPTLRQRQRCHVLGVILVRILLAVADHVEGCCDDLSLLLGELPVEALAPPTAAAPLIGLPVVTPKPPHLQEEDVGRRTLPTPHAVVVRNLRVVRHEVARLEAHLLEVKRVARRHLLGAPRSVVELDSVFRPPVDRIHQAQRPQAVVVLSLHLYVGFLDRRDLDVPARLLEPDDRGLVVERVDYVVRRGHDPTPVEPIQHHAIQRLALNGDGSREFPVVLEVQGNRIAHPSTPVDHDHATGDRHRGTHGQIHLRPAQRCNVSAVLLDHRAQSGIGREPVPQVELLDERKIRHLDVEYTGPHTRGFDGVVGRLFEVEKKDLVDAGLGTPPLP